MYGLLSFRSGVRGVIAGDPPGSFGAAILDSVRCLDESSTRSRASEYP
jgi:hypothetical protein